MVGAGVFLLPAALASYWSISLLGWVLSAIGALFIAKVFSEISKLLPQLDGGPYAYTRRGFGDFAGFLVAWGYWISVWCANAAIAVSLVSALSTFIPQLATNSVLAIFTGLSAIWLLTWVSTIGIKATGEVQLITTILKLIPLATMLGTGITVLIYILGTMSVMGVIPAKDLQHSVTPFADAAAKIWGEPARYWISAGVAVAAFGALNGWILIQGQIPFAIAKDKLFPAFFAKENRKGVPSLAIVFGSVLVSVIMVMNFTKGLVEQFKFMILLSTLTSLIPYLLVSAAYVIIVMEREEPLTRRAWIRVLVPGCLAFIFSLLAIIGAGQEIVFWGLILLLGGTPFYVWNIWKRRPREAPHLKKSL